MYLFNSVLLLTIIVVAIKAQNITWIASFSPEALHLHMGTCACVTLQLSNISVPIQGNLKFVAKSREANIANVNKTIFASEIDQNYGNWTGNITIEGNFIGSTDIFIEIYRDNGTTTETFRNELKLTVTRLERSIDKVFGICIAIIVPLITVNFGAALDLNALKSILTRPIGPAVGLLCQFGFMPVLSFLLGLLLFPDNTEARLGLFFTGVSPGGGASNIWTIVLRGNLNLSVTMTTISTLSAFAMMPFWIFTLGRVILDRANLKVAYDKVAFVALAIIIPLSIGIIIQKYWPGVAKILVRVIKPVAILLLLTIILFAIITNSFWFTLFTWQVIVAGLALPWMGYSLGWIISKLCKQTPADAITIAIETGIQNIPIAIFLINFTLSQPSADLTTVLPIAVTTMAPIPPLLYFIINLISNRCVKSKKIVSNDEDVRLNE